MQDKKETNPALAFVQEMNDLFSKHSTYFISQDELLKNEQFEKFKELYATLDQEVLGEMVMAQHFKVNMLFQAIIDKQEVTMQILRDVSSCKDFMAFDDLKKKARAILMAQDLVNKGKSVEEVMGMVEKETAGVPSSIIV